MCRHYAVGRVGADCQYICPAANYTICEVKDCCKGSVTNYAFCKNAPLCSSDSNLIECEEHRAYDAYVAAQNSNSSSGSRRRNLLQSSSSGGSTVRNQTWIDNYTPVCDTYGNPDLLAKACSDGSFVSLKVTNATSGTCGYDACPTSSFNFSSCTVADCCTDGDNYNTCGLLGWRKCSMVYCPTTAAASAARPELTNTGVIEVSKGGDATMEMTVKNTGKLIVAPGATLKLDKPPSCVDRDVARCPDGSYAKREGDSCQHFCPRESLDDVSACRDADCCATSANFTLPPEKAACTKAAVCATVMCPNTPAETAKFEANMADARSCACQDGTVTLVNATGGNPCDECPAGGGRLSIHTTTTTTFT